MRMMHLGDLHIGKVVNQVQMLEDQLYVLEQVKQYIKEYKPDCLLLAGDIYDRSVPPAVAVSAFNDFISTVLLELKTPILAVAGNHDGADLISYGRELFEKVNLHIEGKFDANVKKVTLSDADGPVNFYLVPFADYQVVREHLQNPEIKSLHEAMKATIETMNLDVSKRNVLVTHAFVSGGESTESEKTLVIGGKENVGAELFKDFNYVALGHLHRCQKIGSDKIRYSGALLKYSFSEEHYQKSMTMIDLDALGEVAITLLPLTPRRDMRSIEGTLEEIIATSCPDNNADYIRAVITDKGELIEPMAKLRQAYPNAMLLEFLNRQGDFTHVSLSHEARQSKTPFELFADYYEHARNEMLNEEQQQAVLAVLKTIEGEES